MSLPISYHRAAAAANDQNRETEKRERRDKGLLGAWTGTAADEQHRSWTPCP